MFALIPRMAAALVFSNDCAGCDTPLKMTDPLGICEKCHAQVRWIASPFCQVCSRPLVHERPRCADCQSESFHFDRAFARTIYEGKIKSLLHVYKFEHQSSLKNFFAHLLCEFIEKYRAFFEFDSVVAVPLDRSKQNERGFNQTALLASRLAKKYKKVHLSRFLRRQKPGTNQSLLAKHEREKNVLGCFAASDSEVFKDRKVLLVDDIFTTGRTASECAKVLKEAGAANVWVLTVARGL